MIVIDGRFTGRTVEEVGSGFFRVSGQDLFLKTELRDLEECDDILDIADEDLWSDAEGGSSEFYQIVEEVTSRDLINQARELLGIAAAAA